MTASVILHFAVFCETSTALLELSVGVGRVLLPVLKVLQSEALLTWQKIVYYTAIA